MIKQNPIAWLGSSARTNLYDIRYNIRRPNNAKNNMKKIYSVSMT